MKLTNSGVKTCETLLQEYMALSPMAKDAEKLNFTGVGDKDVYNITAPFLDQGELVIAGRVESRDSEHSEVFFFVERDGAWVPREGAPTFELQDPFFTRIRGELIVGGVQIYPHPTMENALMWRTVFYKGAAIQELKPFFTGPDGMKDLRLVELQDGSIGVFTRPQGDKGGRGKIGFTRVERLEDLSIEIINDAPLLEGQFTDEEWGGANEAHLLANGLIGVLGHIACFDTAGDRHYYPGVFAFNPQTGEHSNIQLISIRDKFLPGATKRPDLVDVVFSGGIVRRHDGTATIYCGISDAEAHRMTIQDPFLSFEQA
ncbi:MTP-1 family protein [Paenibacillus marinisediminis]